MNAFYPFDKRPIQYGFLGLSVLAISIFDLNIYKQASDRRYDDLREPGYYYEDINSGINHNNMDWKLTGVSSATATSGDTAACILVVPS